MSTSVKVRVIVSNSSTSDKSTHVAKGHKHLSFLADYFNPKSSSNAKPSRKSKSCT